MNNDMALELSCCKRAARLCGGETAPVETSTTPVAFDQSCAKVRLSWHWGWGVGGGGEGERRNGWRGFGGALAGLVGLPQ